MLALVLAAALSAELPTDVPADAPVADVPAADAGTAEAPSPALSLETEQKVTELTASKPSLVGPFFAIGMGAVVVFWGGYIGLVGWLMSGQAVWFAPGSIVAALGLSLDAVGVVRLISTFRERRAIDRQIEALLGI